MFLDNLICYQSGSPGRCNCFTTDQRRCQRTRYCYHLSDRHLWQRPRHLMHLWMVIRTDFAWEQKISCSANDLKLVTVEPSDVTRWMTKFSMRNRAVICFRFASNLRLNAKLELKARRILRAVHISRDTL